MKWQAKQQQNQRSIKQVSKTEEKQPPSTKKVKKKRDQRMREPVPGFAEERSLGTQFSCKLTVKEKQFSDQEK